LNFESFQDLDHVISELIGWVKTQTSSVTDVSIRNIWSNLNQN